MRKLPNEPVRAASWTPGAGAFHGGPLILFVPPDATQSEVLRRSIAVCEADGTFGGWLEPDCQPGRASYCMWVAKPAGSPRGKQFEHLEEAVRHLSPKHALGGSTLDVDVLSLWTHLSSSRHFTSRVVIDKLMASLDGAAGTAETSGNEVMRPPNEERFASPEPIPEESRLALLERAARAPNESQDPMTALKVKVRDDAIALLGGEAVLGRAVRSDEDLVQAIASGFPSQVLRALQDAGLPHKALEQVIAPRRTLMRRRGQEQRLTRPESDAAWRLSHALVLARDVLNGTKAAVAWLSRPKTALNNRTPLDLLETSVGSAHVERLLRQLEWGDVA